MVITQHFIVSGTVQGVFYRASTLEKAQSIGLTGWVRNSVDGRVEVLASGSQAQLDKLYTWLQLGPSHASVTDVFVEEVGLQEFAKFVVRPTGDCDECIL